MNFSVMDFFSECEAIGDIYWKKITNSQNLIFCSVLLLTIRNLGKVMIRMMNCFVKCISLISILFPSRLSFSTWKVFKYGVISGQYFPVFGLNTKIYSVNLRVQFEYRKIGTRNNSVCGHFSHSVGMDLWLFCKGARIQWQ